MTRYARGKGSKGCNTKQENTPTSWSLLKESLRRDEGLEHGNNEEAPKRKHVSISLPEAGNDSWFDFCAKRKNVVLCGKVRKVRAGIASNSEKNRGKIAVKSQNYDVSLMPDKFGGRRREAVAINNKRRFNNEAFSDEKTVSKVKSKLVPTLSSRRTNAGRKLKVLSKEDLKDLRRKEKAVKREKKKVCFCCRRWGHQLADCPEFVPIDSSDVSPPAGGLCYHCGSTEHNVKQCSKNGANSLKFARCFVCGEDGHLARQCQDNPKGKYPKGGACRICGETNHLCSECPKGVNKDNDIVNSLSLSVEGPVDGLPEDMGKHWHPNGSPKKIIQF